MQSGALTAVELVSAYLERIALLDQSEGGVNSIIEINPDALQIAAELDAERASGQIRGPLHGIPVVIKDNIDTGDKMLTRLCRRGPRNYP